MNTNELKFMGYSLSTPNSVGSFHVDDEVNNIFVNRRSSLGFWQPNDFESTPYSADSSQDEKKWVTGNEVIAKVTKELEENSYRIAKCPTHFCFESNHARFLTWEGSKYK